MTQRQKKRAVQSKTKPRTAPATASKETTRLVMFALANAMGYSRSSDIVEEYLAGKDVRGAIGRHGVWHFDFMMGLLGHRSPEDQS